MCRLFFLSVLVVLIDPSALDEFGRKTTYEASSQQPKFARAPTPVQLQTLRSQVENE